MAAIDIGAWLTERGVGYHDHGPMPDGRRKFTLDVCPFDESHTGKDAAIFQSPDGKLGFKCFHDSCADKQWSDCRDQIGGLDVARFLREGDDKTVSPSPYRGRYIERSPQPPGYDPKPISAEDLVLSDYPLRWLVEDTLELGPPVLVGGPQKALKTSVVLDLLVSVASATPFLGRFRVPESRPCYFVSGEINPRGIKQRLLAICDDRLVDPTKLPLTFSFALPCLSVRDHLETVKQEIRRTGAQLYVIDPAYLALLSEHNAGDAANLFSMGSVLREFGSLAQETGASMVIIHHFRKRQQTSRGFVPPGLSDMSMSGFAEWARQWMLVDRRARYAAGSGLHELYLGVGGSGGYGHEHALDVREGDWRSPQWDVSLTPWSEAEGIEAFERADREGDKRAERHEAKLQQVREAIAAGKRTGHAIKTWVGASGTTVAKLLAELERAGDVELSPAGYILREASPVEA